MKKKLLYLAAAREAPSWTLTKCFSIHQCTNDLLESSLKKVNKFIHFWKEQRVMDLTTHLCHHTEETDRLTVATRSLVLTLRLPIPIQITMNIFTESPPQTQLNQSPLPGIRTLHIHFKGSCSSAAHFLHPFQFITPPHPHVLFCPLHIPSGLWGQIYWLRHFDSIYLLKATV